MGISAFLLYIACFSLIVPAYQISSTSGCACALWAIQYARFVPDDLPHLRGIAALNHTRKPTTVLLPGLLQQIARLVRNGRKYTVEPHATVAVRLPQLFGGLA